MIADKLIRQVEWTACTFWSKMRGNECDDGDEYEEYTENDIDNFVEIIFREIAENLGVKYSEIKDVLYGRNISFFERKARYFAEYETIYENGEVFKELTKELRLPSIWVRDENPVARFMEYFERLKIEDKITVLETLNSSNIKIPLESTSVEYRNFLQDFCNMGQADKCAIVKNILHAQITRVD